MNDVIFENPGKKKLSKPIDYFKRLPKDTLDKLTNTKKKEVNVKDES